MTRLRVLNNTQRDVGFDTAEALSAPLPYDFTEHTKGALGMVYEPTLVITSTDLKSKHAPISFAHELYHLNISSRRNQDITKLGKLARLEEEVEAVLWSSMKARVPVSSSDACALTQYAMGVIPLNQLQQLIERKVKEIGYNYNIKRLESSIRWNWNAGGGKLYEQGGKFYKQNNL